MGRAFYAKEMWNEAKEQLEVVAQLQPCWRESIVPYLEGIERRLKAISKDPASKMYFMDGSSPSPLPLMHLGDQQALQR